MKIICINGQGGVGKDTFVFFCRTGTINDVYSFSMVDGIKQIATSLGWNGEKNLKGRRFLSDLKDLADNYSDYSFNKVLGDITIAIFNYSCFTPKDEQETNELICFIHTREPKDLKRWKEEHGAKSLLIRRRDVEGFYDNHADDYVFDYDYDYYIYNDGTIEELSKKAHEFMEKIKSEEWESHI